MKTHLISMLLLKHGKIGHATRNRDILLLWEIWIWTISKLKRFFLLGSWRGYLFTNFEFSIKETFRKFDKYFACWYYWKESVRSFEQSSCHFMFTFNCSQQYRKSMSCCQKIIKSFLQTYRYRARVGKMPL